ncbi:hypothetical protein AB2N08_22585 [Massilia aurea]|uniref:hypothetical protein n=1 Tax=Massilia aurea TaxID=373040 RepID=UPI003461C1CB
MKRSQLLLLLPLAAPLPAPADDFPTSGRVEYVLECMQKHDGKQEYLYKCSCVVDRIAGALPYDDFVAMSMALRNQSLSGERGGVFRDAPSSKSMAGKFRDIEAGANKACAVPQK